MAKFVGFSPPLWAREAGILKALRWVHYKCLYLRPDTSPKKRAADRRAKYPDKFPYKGGHWDPSTGKVTW